VLTGELNRRKVGTESSRKLNCEGGKLQQAEMRVPEEEIEETAIITLDQSLSPRLERLNYLGHLTGTRRNMFKCI
jgi:hypothetical protein